MNNYSNPMVTYDEVVEAIKAIIECSKANGYLDDYGFLNVKYDSLNKNPIREEQEQLLIDALQSLEKTIDATNKVIREKLEQELAELATNDLFTIYADYEHSEERRKLASHNELVMRLKEMSLPIEVLNSPSDEIEDLEELEELPAGMEEIVDEEVEEIDEPVEENEEEEITEEAEVPVEASSDEEEHEEVAEEAEEETPKVDLAKIQLIKKALDKAREKGNDQLVKLLEQQLQKELENLK